MNLYLVENHVNYTMNAECKAISEEKQPKGKAQLNGNRYTRPTTATKQCYNINTSNHLTAKFLSIRRQ